MRILLWINDSYKISNKLTRLHNILKKNNFAVDFYTNREDTSIFFKDKGI